MMSVAGKNAGALGAGCAIKGNTTKNSDNGTSKKVTPIGRKGQQRRTRWTTMRMTPQSRRKLNSGRRGR